MEDKVQTLAGNAYEGGKQHVRTEAFDNAQEGCTKTWKGSRTEPASMQSIPIAGAGGQTLKSPIETHFAPASVPSILIADVEIETSCNLLDPKHKEQRTADGKVTHHHVEPSTEMHVLQNGYGNREDEGWANPETVVQHWPTSESEPSSAQHKGMVMRTIGVGKGPTSENVACVLPNKVDAPTMEANTRTVQNDGKQHTEKVVQQLATTTRHGSNGITDMAVPIKEIKAHATPQGVFYTTLTLENHTSTTELNTCIGPKETDSIFMAQLHMLNTNDEDSFNNAMWNGQYGTVCRKLQQTATHKQTYQSGSSSLQQTVAQLQELYHVGHHSNDLYRELDGLRKGMGRGWGGDGVA